MHQKCIKSATWRLQEATKTPPGYPKTDLASVCGAYLGPSWAPFSAQDSLQAPQDASKRHSWECLGASWGRVGASWRPRANKSVSWSRLGLIFVHFWKVFRFMFGRFLIDVHWFVGRFLVDFLIFFLSPRILQGSAVAGSPLCGALDIYIYIYIIIIFFYFYYYTVLFTW